MPHPNGDRPHIPVLAQEIVSAFSGRKLSVFFEGTVGAGGHAELLLEAHPEVERYIGCDVDPEALSLARERLKPWAHKVDLIQGNFAHLEQYLQERKCTSVDGFLFDLGVSSMQLDQGYKGFSFSKEGPLDMRMDPLADLTAEEVVNSWPEQKLGLLFKDLGEEPRWKRAARAIVERRKKKRIQTTTDLAEILSSTLKTALRGKWHPATLVFQALRICVNRELDVISEGISKAIHMLSSGGLIGAISFHSLEDRIVKNLFREAARSPDKKSGLPPLLQLLTKKPIVPSQEEIRINPRSRSARLRLAERT